MVMFVFKNFHLHISYSNLFKSLNKFFLKLEITSYNQFVLGKISPNFDLKTIILTYPKDFSWKNDPNPPNFENRTTTFS